MESIDTGYFQQSGAWKVCVYNGNTKKCLSLLQFHGASLLSRYLNGGIGKSILIYPLYLAVSKSLLVMAQDLVAMWRDYNTLSSNETASRILDAIDEDGVESVISAHYRLIDLIELKEKLQPVLRQSVSSKPVDKKKRIEKLLLKDIGSATVYLHSFWVHGSIGSSDEKETWSDVDTLAIVDREAVINPVSLARLRKKLILSRRRMVDYFPFQVHGHFILAEQDLRCYPSALFPAVLFDSARCLCSKAGDFVCYSYQDQYIALNMLWNHGVKDLIDEIQINQKGISKILFLHRIYLLPCLVFQVLGRPAFKKDVFSNLSEFFTKDECELFFESSKIWRDWSKPKLLPRLIVRFAKILRYNPILYQKFSHIIGSKLTWVPDSGMEWDSLSANFRNVSQDIWNRLAELSSN